MAPGGRRAGRSEHSDALPAHAGGRYVSDAERGQIRALHADGKSCNAIAAEIGRSRSTVSYQCRKMGLSFDRAATVEAVHAHVADAKARRALLSEAMLANAVRLNAQMFESCEDMAPVGGPEPTVLRWQRDEPSFADKERIARGAGLLSDKHMKLAEFDSDDGTGGEARALLNAVLDGLTGKHGDGS